MVTRDTTERDYETSTVTTTVGEYIEALTEVAEQAGRTQQECFHVASILVEKVLREKRQRQLLS
jgi:hypothetical protein